MNKIDINWLMIDRQCPWCGSSWKVEHKCTSSPDLPIPLFYPPKNWFITKEYVKGIHHILLRAVPIFHPNEKENKEYITDDIARCFQSNLKGNLCWDHKKIHERLGDI